MVGRKTRAQERASSIEPGAAELGSQSASNRKRSASVLSQVSELQQGESQPDTQSIAPKKRKKTKTTVVQTTRVHDNAEHPQLLTVDEGNAQSDTDINGSTDVQVRSQVISKTITDRRVTLDPSAFNGSQSTQALTKSRKSLPTNITAHHFENLTEPNVLSLKVLVQQRIKQRMHERQSITQLDGSDDLVPYDEHADMLVYSSLNGPSEVPQLADASAESMIDTDNATLGWEVDSVLATKHEQERLAYESSIDRLTREAADAKSNLEILTVELQSMGFATAANTQGVLDSIRSSFDQVRLRLRDILPGATSDEIVENVMLAKITEHIIHLAHQKSLKDRLITDKEVFEKDLLVQIDLLIERLTDAEIYKTQLEKANGEFEAQGREDDQYIKDMEHKLKDIGAQLSHVSALLQKSVILKQGLQTDNKHLEETSAKLKNALAGYRESEDKLHKLITRMEREHADALELLEKDHSTEHSRLSDELATEIATRTSLEKAAEESAATIAGLDAKRSSQKTIIKDLQKAIEQLRTESATLTEDYAEVDALAATRLTEINHLQQQLETANTTLEKLEIDFNNLTQLNESEKRQREAAESDLDNIQTQVNDLNDKLHRQGVEANELRQKLFEVQQRTEKTVKDLQATSDQREEQHQSDIDAEIQRREDAENLAEDRQARISDLESRLTKLETNMEKALAEKERLLQQMEELTDNLQAELEQTKALLESTTTEHVELQKSSETKYTKFDITIRDLESELDHATLTLEKTQKQAALQQEQMSLALADRDAMINAATAEIADCNVTITTLEADKISLERRVESEAEAMLLFQAEKDEETQALRKAIAQKQGVVENLGVKAIEADRAWKAVLEERDDRIVEIEATLEERSDTVVFWKDKNAELKDMFRAFVQKTEGVISGQEKELEHLRLRVGRENQDLTKDAEELLEKLDVTEEEAQIVHVNGHGAHDEADKASPLVQIVQKKKMRRTKKTIRDSGIAGVSEDDTMLA